MEIFGAVLAAVLLFAALAIDNASRRNRTPDTTIGSDGGHALVAYGDGGGGSDGGGSD